jgi:hypothetical protein
MYRREERNFRGTGSENLLTLEHLSYLAAHAAMRKTPGRWPSPDVPELFQAAQRRFRSTGPDLEFREGTDRVEIWDADDFDPWLRPVKPLNGLSKGGSIRPFVPSNVV